MTVREMIYEFQRLIETMSDEFKGVEKPDSDTMLRFLNWSYDRYIKDKYLSGRSLHENIANIIANSHDLTKLIANYDDILLQGTTYDELRSFTLPDDYVYFIRADISINREGGPLSNSEGTINYLWIPAQPIDLSELDELLTTDINQPIIEKPAVIIIDKLYGNVITDKYTLADNIKLTYLKKQKELMFIDDVSGDEMECELASYLHEELVKLAVEMYIMDYKLRLSQKQTGGEA